MPGTATQNIEKRVHAIRQFNRFYTQKIGVLGDGHLTTQFSLTEARILYELAHRDLCTAGDIAKDLGLDPGYLSRILRKFTRKDLITRAASDTDGRAQMIVLTKAGVKAFALLNEKASVEIKTLLQQLSDEAQESVVRSMGVIQSKLQPDCKIDQPVVFRSHQPGDMGWITYRQARLYFEEYGWNEEFEALVASIIAQFIQNYDPTKEHCWIAERGTEILGSVFLIKESDTTAKLRLLYVESQARGMGLGMRLVQECIRFARRAGYKTIVLWTNDILHAARHIYERCGFVLVSEEKHFSFGKHLVAQTWQVDLESLPSG
jgi:DNA-binding MarR family transcriptional regulator/GNAT superfamily N-acetyltransferase